MEEKTKRILVTIDGSKNAERALDEAKVQAEYSDAIVTILTVVKPLFLTYYGKSELLKQDNKELEKSKKALLKKSLEIFEEYPGEVKTKLRKGDTAEEILKETEECEYDLIVMGSKGLGIFTRALLGSVSSKILNYTETNVLIVK